MLSKIKAAVDQVRISLHRTKSARTAANGGRIPPTFFVVQPPENIAKTASFPGKTGDDRLAFLTLSRKYSVANIRARWWGEGGVNSPCSQQRTAGSELFFVRVGPTEQAVAISF